MGTRQAGHGSARGHNLLQTDTKIGIR